MIPLVTPGAERFVTRGDLPRARPPPGRARTRIRTSTRADLLVVAPLHREHAGQARARDRRQRAHRGGARASRAGARRARDEPAHVGASGDARERRDARARGASSSSGPTRASWPRASGASGGWPSPARDLRAAVGAARAAARWPGERVLVTAGGTREPLDSVRFVGNRSSGRMGVALAAEARRRGADVMLLAREPVRGVARRRRGDPDADRRVDARRSARAAPTSTSALLAAAVADYRPAEALAGKRPKDAQGWTVELEPTADVARALGERKRDGQLLVAFGAEHGDDGLEREAGDARRRRTPTSSSSTTSGAATSASTPPRTRSCSSRATASGTSPKASKSAIAAADPRRGRAAAGRIAA